MVSFARQDDKLLWFCSLAMHYYSLIGKIKARGGVDVQFTGNEQGSIDLMIRKNGRSPGDLI